MTFHASSSPTLRLRDVPFDEFAEIFAMRPKVRTHRGGPPHPDERRPRRSRKRSRRPRTDQEPCGASRPWRFRRSPPRRPSSTRPNAAPSTASTRTAAAQEAQATGQAPPPRHLERQALALGADRRRQDWRVRATSSTTNTSRRSTTSVAPARSRRCKGQDERRRGRRDRRGEQRPTGSYAGDLRHPPGDPPADPRGIRPRPRRGGRAGRDGPGRRGPVADPAERRRRSSPARRRSTTKATRSPPPTSGATTTSGGSTG